MVKKIQVLVVDEHPEVVRALADRLRTTEHIHVLEPAATLEQALEIVAQQRPDIVLLGLKVQEPPGSAEFLRRMAAAFAQHQSGVIILSPYADDEERQAALDAGAQRYLLKDIDSDRLIEEIEKVTAELFPSASGPA